MNHNDISAPGRGVPTIRLSYEQLRDTLGRFEYFRHWTEDQIRECSILARVVQYAPHQTIPLDLPLPFAYLILSGQCMIMQCLQLTREPTLLSRSEFRLASTEGGVTPPSCPDTASPKAQLELIQNLHDTFNSGQLTDPTNGSVPYDPDKSICFLKTPPQEKPVVHRFLDVGTLGCGAVFGLGERHHHRTIVARTRTQCLLIPRCWLFLKPQNIGNTWQRLCMYLDCILPGRDELFRRFLRDKAWLEYRRWLISETTKRRSGTVMADVPVMCRILQTTPLSKQQEGKSCKKKRR
uniref:Cyclic nucleotide-binding domain-containing protein n=1 Tax=Anopheles culicifacies TaxID=139723 RepID=A0A182MUD4_9DIPT